MVHNSYIDCLRTLLVLAKRIVDNAGLLTIKSRNCFVTAIGSWRATFHVDESTRSDGDFEAKCETYKDLVEVINFEIDREIARIAGDYSGTDR